MKLEPDTLLNVTSALAVVVSSVCTQKYVLILVKAGEMPVIVTVEGVPETSGALPTTICAVVSAVAEQVDVVPQNCTFGWFDSVRFGTVVVEETFNGAVPVATFEVNVEAVTPVLKIGPLAGEL